MKLSSIPQIRRHLGRWYEIVAVLGKYGLAAWIGRLGPDFAKDMLKARGGAAIAREPLETRLRQALAELGPTFIKLGQILSTRPDLVGVRLAEEFQQLQENVHADPPEVVRRLVEAELGRPIETLFAEFEPQAMASASIGQVHRARLHSGEAVVVKVLHADIEKKVSVDMDILAGLANDGRDVARVPQLSPLGDCGRVSAGDAAGTGFRPRGAEHPAVRPRFPRRPDRLHSAHLSRAFEPAGADDGAARRDQAVGAPAAGGRRASTGDEVARRGAAICLKMIFDNGFYHADPHPGNLLVMEGCRIGLLDFGMVGRIDERLHEEGERNARRLEQSRRRTHDRHDLAAGQDAGRPGPAGLCLDVADFLSYYASQSLDRFDLSGALNEMMEQVRRYHIMLPARIVMLLKALVTLEGTARLVSPKFSLVEMIQPYRRKLIWRRFSPRRRLRKLHRLYSELEHLLDILPQGIADILDQMQGGRFDIHLDHRGLEPSVNRLVLGMLASALFVGASLLLSRNVPPLMFGTSARRRRRPPPW